MTKGVMQAQRPLKRRAIQRAPEILIRGPSGNELCRFPAESDPEARDLRHSRTVDADVRDLKLFLRERLGVPVDWQRLMVGTRVLNNPELLADVAQPGTGALELTLLKTLSNQE